FMLQKRILAKKTKLENPKSLLQANRQRASSKLSQGILVSGSSLSKDEFAQRTELPLPEGLLTRALRGDFTIFPCKNCS
ncbi:hypothetical protein A2U01_0054239, partial [Trifolium medium]|nr:hypothetical protein [Trifolium medium]